MGRFGRREGAVVAGLALVGSTVAWAPNAAAAPGDAADRNPSAHTKIRRQSMSESAADRGRERARAGDCEGAIDAFDAALRSTVDPTLRRDRGFCHEKLGNDFPAMDDYRAYLTAMPDADDYDAVHDRLMALENNHGGDNIASAQSAANHAGTSSAYGEGVTINGSTGASIDSSGEKPDKPSKKGGASIGVGFRDDDESRLAKDTIFIELGGPSLVYSLNYDHMFSEHVSFRLGAGYWSHFSTGNDFIFTVPLMLNGLIGNGNHKAEIGAGADLLITRGPFAFNSFRAGSTGAATITSASQATTANVTSAINQDVSSATSTTVLPIPQVYVGYRYAPKDGGFSFRVGGSLLATFNDGLHVMPWPGISFGYSF